VSAAAARFGKNCPAAAAAPAPKAAFKNRRRLRSKKEEGFFMHLSSFVPIMAQHGADYALAQAGTVAAA
jgi:hypothetical protein